MRISRPVSVLVAAAVTLLACWLVYTAEVPNPVIVLVVFMIALTALAGNIEGAASGACIVLYALFFFSEGHSFTAFSAEGAYKCLVIVLSLAAIYALTAFIRRKRDETYRRLVELNLQLEERNEDLQRESDHDALTGIYNRRGGVRKIREIVDVEEGERRDDPFAVLAAMDIDDFKEINDVYGHEAGDNALRYFASCLEEEFTGGSVLMRNGGDEFAVLLCGSEQARMEAQVVRFCARTFSFSFKGRTVEFHISSGYAVFPTQARGYEKLSRMADAALYFVKISGKHKAAPYSLEIDAEARGELQLSMRNVAENLPVAFMVYRADETEQILIASDGLLALCDCRTFDEFYAHTGGTFRGFVHPDDVEKVERSIDEQIQVNPYNLDSVQYRIVTRAGGTVKVRDLGRLVDDPNLGKLFYVALLDDESIAQASAEAAAGPNVPAEQAHQPGERA